MTPGHTVGGGRALRVGGPLPGFTLPGDISASARYFAHDVAGPNFVLNDDSTLTVPTGPGIGVEPDPAAMEKENKQYQKFSES